MKLTKTLLLTLSLSLWSQFALAKACFSFNPGKDLKIQWTGYKTPDKVGVSGEFKMISGASTQGSNLVESLKKANISIVTTKDSVDSDKSSRDKRLANSFFENTNITGRISKVTGKKVTLEVTLFGKTAPIEMNYKINDHQVVAEGTLDILSFSGSKQLAALNKACSSLHKGKTWSDVALKLTAKTHDCSTAAAK